jgi:hypothetical protein
LWLTRRICLDPHFHTLALNGIYVVNDMVELVFRCVPPPSDAEVARVAARVHRSVTRLMERRGLDSQADPDEADILRHEEPLLAELYSASIAGRVATGQRAGRRIARVGAGVDREGSDLPSGRCCASVAGFSVHAGVRVPPPRDCMRLEHLARYAARPPLATERLSLLPDGRLLYRLKRRWRDGTAHVIYEPLELVERLAALVPPPKFNVTRYFGVLAPGATFRSLIIPPDRAPSPPPHRGCPAGVPKTASGKAGKKRGVRWRNYLWAQLMVRVFELDILTCPRCGSRMRILCAIHPPSAIRKILACLGLPTRAPPLAPAVPDREATALW